MLKCATSFWKFLNYWYFRYLMVTELYMVEKWERAVCHISIVIFLCILSYINCTLLQFTSKIFNLEVPSTPTIHNSSST